jgi:hypothetical protein
LSIAKCKFFKIIKKIISGLGNRLAQSDRQTPEGTHRGTGLDRPADGDVFGVTEPCGG